MGSNIENSLRMDLSYIANEESLLCMEILEVQFLSHHS